MTSAAPVPTTATSNPLLTSVMAAMHDIAPLSLADASWDNVGLLLESPTPPSSTSATAAPQSAAAPGHEANGVMLGIDLTTQVCDEIVSTHNQGQPRIGVAVIYHPLIFRGLKSITYNDPQQASILRLLQHGVSLYCPHTSLDAAAGGINDWLAVVVSHDSMPDLGGQEGHRILTTGNWQPIVPSKEKDTNGQSGAGMGRLVTLDREITFEQAVDRVKANLQLDHVQGCPSGKAIKTIGVCAGSGSSVFRGVKADLLLTGELSHHEVLAYKAAGTSVIVTNHTNTERKYLRDVLQHRLRDRLPKDATVLISKMDQDPLHTF
ncbi:uncharacterized protein PFL1_01735 [Pseudozyma flocculosa PF-1]|uniref:Related to Ngg1p-interacting factor 3 n=1 Tax=Pseudozyma flocculosa TaxID=84751 RepID=A0A5C3F0J8_9BASI|nr:uncharacterized protein PFL1_01735 [Pseudozyma flocculosa PF-1]EPQ30837.1 hypothetical protein PFL1_01735 [Pseudozyma flocculosa PF-1]SPO36791.1 related to Ngg1p-interacting factor 3 [Pseudozyma flocculosa]